MKLIITYSSHIPGKIIYRGYGYEYKYIKYNEHHLFYKVTYNII